jgi:hypothetical protein
LASVRFLKADLFLILSAKNDARPKVLVFLQHSRSSGWQYGDLCELCEIAGVRLPVIQQWRETNGHQGGAGEDCWIFLKGRSCEQSTQRLDAIKGIGLQLTES